jgi:Surp module
LEIHFAWLGGAEVSSLPPPPPAEPPADAETRRNADMLALYVARNGPQFEAVACGRLQANPKFAFLFGGDGAVYYRWKLHRMKVGGRRDSPFHWRGISPRVFNVECSSRCGFCQGGHFLMCER